MKRDSGELVGKVAFVTGAASGIGRAATLAFAREGVAVTACDLSAEGNAETVRLVEGRRSGACAHLRSDQF